MKQLTYFTLMLAFVISGFTGTAQENKRDEILSRHFEAMDQEKLENIQTIKMHGKTQTQGRDRLLPG